MYVFVNGYFSLFLTSGGLGVGLFAFLLITFYKNNLCWERNIQIICFFLLFFCLFGKNVESWKLWTEQGYLFPPVSSLLAKLVLVSYLNYPI